MKKVAVCILLGIILLSCSTQPTDKQEENSLTTEVQQYLDAYTRQFVDLYYKSSLAQWETNTHIVEGDTTNAYQTQLTSEALAAFTGSKENIEKARQYLAQSNKLDSIQVRQLRTILYAAANNPATVSDVVKKRIKAETAQTEKLFGYNFTLNGKPVTTNDIDEILKDEKNITRRLNAWTASKEVGKNLKTGLTELQQLRNKTVQALGYKDYFSYQVSEYGIDVPEMMKINKKLIQDVWPLYRELHTYARYELAKKYGQTQVPDMLPAHWVPNRWGQDWSGMVEVEGIDLDGVLASKGPEWLVKQAERFYISLGFDSLPKSFYEKSSLYPAPVEAKYKKNNHASAWHMDLQQDVRSLMSVIPNSEWYETTHHELGHVYYYMSYTNPGVPPLLRSGANRAFHEAVGSMMGLAAMQKPFLANLQLIKPETKTDETQELLKEALNYIVFIPFSAGVMTEFEHDLYVNNLPADQYNKRWWELTAKYQGMIPPSPRGEEYCDAASKTHINDDAAQYYDYALSYALLFQLHDHIATHILKQNPKATNYYGSKPTGDFLKQILSPGASRDWRELLKESTGKELNAEAMLNYFQPLMVYLKEVNKGRKYTLSENI
ncbi:M2 family metallopeptidase [Rhodocytophaga rosea]|uniref:M2 family metallopeptidase n=2 Tax=Rhodocytophaga rosea TaxID=2704465 RepID=A0A6C0GVV2_9BACT|nr:M2 family metallopeptidase [Rhodocytophaga rosea]